MTIIWAATVEHKHGANLFAATTKTGIYTQLADYCREWWDHEMPKEAPQPAGMSNRDVVRYYFEYMSDHGDEWHLVEEVPLMTEDAAVNAKS